MRFSPQPAGATQNLINILIPLGNYAGTLELKAFDNVGNSSVATVSAPLPISPNTDPYVVSLSVNSALSSGGQRLPLDGDDQYYLYNLPFNVPMGSRMEREIDRFAMRYLPWATTSFPDAAYHILQTPLTLLLTRVLPSGEKPT